MSSAISFRMSAASSGSISSRTSAARSSSSAVRICDRLLFDHLAEDVGEPFVAERSDDVATALVAEVLQGVREISGAQLLVRLQQSGSSLVVGVEGEPGDLVPVGDELLASSPQRLALALHVDLGDLPVARAQLLHADVEQRDRCSSSSTRVTGESSSSPTTRSSPGRCSKRRRFSRPLTTTPPASIDVTRVIGTKIRRRGCTSRTRPMMPWRPRSRSQGGDDVANLAELVAAGVEDRSTRQAGDEDSGRGAHTQRLPASTLLPSEAPEPRRSRV